MDPNDENSDLGQNSDLGLDIIIMSRPRSESGPVLNWTSPDQNSDLGWPRSEFSSLGSKSLIIYHC